MQKTTLSTTIPLIVWILTFACPGRSLSADDGLLERYRSDAIAKWDKDIEQLEKLNEQEVAPENAILFVGSSSIRLWESMAEDLAPWPTIRRGYGGAKMSDLAIFIDRLVKPHSFDALVIFVANDITAESDDKSPAEVLELYQLIVASVRKHHPLEPIAFIAITPTSSRFQVWDKIKEANQLIADWSRSQPNLHFIQTAERFLDEQGRPNDSLFKDDRLHLNREGYQIWAQILKNALADILVEHEAATR